MNVGIFGGAFDPFHIEHRQIIISAQEALRLDKVVVVPSSEPPHKKCVMSPYAARRKMTEAGTRDLPYVVIDDIEYVRGAVNPTSVVLPLLKEKYPADNLYFIMGGDSAVNFHTWIEPKKITDCAYLAIAGRSDCGDVSKAAEEIERNYSASVFVLPYVGNRVSGSRIKTLAELGMKLEGVSEEVEDIIAKEGLYRRYSDLLNKLRADIDERTFAHCASAALYASNFTGVLRLKFEDVFLSCMLHDCAKHLSFDMENVPEQVAHQYGGAERAKTEYGVEDEGVLDAIRYHTTGRQEMTNLGKLVYCADMLEPLRQFEGVDELRKIIENDFEKGFVACVKASYEHLLNGDKPIYPLTEKCLNYYINN